MREKYSEADLGGQQNSPAFQGAPLSLPSMTPPITRTHQPKIYQASH